MNFVQRIEKEAEELSDKLEALVSFKKTPIYKELSPREKMLLTNQAMWMSNYLDTLNRRIEFYHNKK